MTTKRIESRDNQRLKLVRKIREGRVNDFIFVEGVRLAEEAVKSNTEIEYCLVESEAGRNERLQKLLSDIEKREIEIVEISKPIFPTIADTKSSQGVVLICRRPVSDRNSFEQILKGRGSLIPLIVVLAEVNNPSNLGAVIRTAEAAGAAGVVIAANSSDVFLPKSLRASMGSAFRIPVWDEVSIAEIIEWGRARGYTIAAATGDGRDIYFESDWTKPRILIFGSEAHGITGEISRSVDFTVRIPIEQTVESMNLAVSSGVILFEARRQVLKGPSNV